MELGAQVRDLWLLEPGTHHLNHGGYGATPREVLAEQDRLRALMEAQPTRFFARELPPRLRDAAACLAGFVGTTADRLGFVENATAGINTVLRSFHFLPGDEILTTDHIYGSVRHVLRHVTAATGARVVEVPLGMPAPDDAAIIDAVRDGIGPRTRLLLIDHVASSSAVRMPIAAIAAVGRARGVRVLIDGAHGPGMAELHVDRIGADWYIGNCHKWLCAPKGAAFIAVAPGAAAGVHPLVISHAYGAGFTAEFDQLGTRDATSWLAVPAAIALHERLGGASLRARNRALAAQAAADLAGRLGTILGAAETAFEAMVTVKLKLPTGKLADRAMAATVHDRLLAEHRIEAPVMLLGDALWLRLSAQAYNEPADYHTLADAITEVIA
jgi:isopenicillin-N epimerase